MTDKKYGLHQQQFRRNKRKDDRGDDSNLDDRLADGFDLLSEDDPKDPLSPLFSEVDPEDQEE
jgi:hypothetical protein